jgi:TRAP-type transport system small permease protein
MKRAVRYFSYFLKIGTLVTTMALIVSVLIQIYARFFMENAPAWTEEASRVLFIYSISFASGLAYKQNYFVFLDLLSGRINSRSEEILKNAVNITVFILFFIMAVYAVAYIRLGMAESSPSLGLNMSVSFFSMLLMASSICFFSGIKIIELIKKRQ